MEKEMATHCSILAWRIPWTEEPGGLAVHKSPRVRQDWSELARMCGGRLGETVRKGTTFLLVHCNGICSSIRLLSPLPGLLLPGLFRACTALLFSEVWPAALLPVTRTYSFGSPSVNLVASLNIYCLWNSLSVSLFSRTALKLEELISCVRQPLLKDIVCFLLSWPDLDW